MPVHSKVPITLKAGGVTATFVTFDLDSSDEDHFAVLYPGWDATDVPLVRIHSQCQTGDLFESARCDCGPQLSEAKEIMAERGGIILYLLQEGRGIGLKAKLDAYKLQIEKGMDTFEANRALGFKDDLRNYDVAVEMLTSLGINQVRLLTNNLDKVQGLRDGGIEVVNVVPTGVHVTEHNQSYIDAKRNAGQILGRGAESPAP